MERKYDAKGGNGGIVYNREAGTIKKYLRNTSSKDKIPRFRRELEVFREICKNNIPNVVEVIDVYIDEKNFLESYVEMKMYEGSLYDILDRTKGDVKASLELILPIIKVLYRLSEGNPPLYHRDIKPDNILFSNENETITLYLTDFGTCFLNDGSERLTPETMAIGPRMYIAPEYETGRVEEVTEKGDIFSLGKVIWCMINGKVNDFMPSNFWFVNEYDLTKRFPDNADMIVANTIIASCLSIHPQERCSYPELIQQIEKYLMSGGLTTEETAKLKAKIYQEKRQLELKEIMEKNRLLVNRFSHCYVNALAKLNEVYDHFELLDILYGEYLSMASEKTGYTHIVRNYNAENSFYYRSYDRFVLSIRFVPPEKEERYGKIAFVYNVKTIGKYRTITTYYNAHGVICCEFNGAADLLCEDVLQEYLNSMIMEYISE